MESTGIHKISIRLEVNFRINTSKKVENSLLNINKDLLKLEIKGTYWPTYRPLLFEIPSQKNKEAVADMCRFCECEIETAEHVVY